MTRFQYAYGYRTYAAALAALEHCYATGEVSESERPEITSYTTMNGCRYAIIIDG